VKNKQKEFSILKKKKEKMETKRTFL